MKKCVECKGNVVRKKVPFFMYGVKLGDLNRSAMRQLAESVELNSKAKLLGKPEGKGGWG